LYLLLIAADTDSLCADRITEPSVVAAENVSRYVKDRDLKALQEEEDLNDNLINGAQLLKRAKAVDSGLRDTLEVAGMCAQLGT